MEDNAVAVPTVAVPCEPMAPGSAAQHFNTTKRKSRLLAKSTVDGAQRAALPLPEGKFAQRSRAAAALYSRLVGPAGAPERAAWQASREAEAQALGQGTTMARLSRENVAHVAHYYPLVTSPAQLSDFDSAERVFGSKEFAFSPIFMPALINACCRLGVFPMSTNVGVMVFAPKLHKRRAVVDVAPGLHPSCPAAAEAATAPGGPARRTTPPAPLPGGARRRGRPYSAVVDRGWRRVTALVALQHGEDWYCAPLRAAFRQMHLAAELPTTLHCLTIVDNERLAAGLGAIAEDATPAARAEATEAAIDAAAVAGEFGFVTGSIYTSLTGAYEGAPAREAGKYKGAPPANDAAPSTSYGTVQLAALQALLWATGVQHWDLGMMMTYKEHALSARELRRRDWVSLVVEQRDASCEPRASLAALAGDMAPLCPAPGPLGRIRGILIPCPALFAAYDLANTSS